jgi:RNA recognition motif-containing protein
VSAAEMIKDADSGQSTGFSFVTLRDESDAEKAMSTFNVSR